MKIKKMGVLCVSVCLALLMVPAVVVAVPPPEVSVSDGSIADIGSTTTVSMTLDKAPAGLSGYNVTVSLSDPSIAEIMEVAFPSWAIMNSNDTLPADSVWMKGADLMDLVKPGATNIDLGTLTIRGDNNGQCMIDVTVTKMDDDNGSPIGPDVSPGTLTVGSVVQEYDLTISSTTGGSVTTPGEGTFTYNAGEDVSLLADADTGYQFTSWTGDTGTIGDTGSASTTITMDGNYSITANFAEVIVTYYTLTVTCNPVGTGSVTLDPTQPGEGYVAGTTVKLTAAANAGYSFDSWSGDLSGSANPTNIIMDSNKNVTANFVEIPAGTTPVTGNVVKALYIDVTAPSAIDLGDMLQGATVTGQSSTAGSVDTNAAHWSVEAKDKTNGGYMRLSDSTPLINKLEIKGVGNYADADVGITYVDETSLPFYVSQTVELSDVVATGYSITITFTGLL